MDRKKPLEVEIETLRRELYQRSRRLRDKPDRKTYALSVKMDRLIVKYMKNGKI